MSKCYKKSKTGREGDKRPEWNKKANQFTNQGRAFQVEQKPRQKPWEATSPGVSKEHKGALSCKHRLPRWLSGKDSACQAETWVRSLGWEGPLEKGMATHSSILGCQIPWAEKVGRLQSTGSQSQTQPSNSNNKRTAVNTEQEEWQDDTEKTVVGVLDRV